MGQGAKSKVFMRLTGLAARSMSRSRTCKASIIHLARATAAITPEPRRAGRRCCREPSAVYRAAEISFCGGLRAARLSYGDEHYRSPIIAESGKVLRLHMPDRVYLDWNATTPLRHEAKQAMAAAWDLVGNPSSVHAEGRQARRLV